MEQRTLLEWLGFPAREDLHRDLLGWLISHTGGNCLQAVVTEPVGDLRDVKKEQTFPDKTRIDLVVETTNMYIGIELKVHSSARDGQLSDYARNLKELRKPEQRAVLVFLTESGVVPQFPDEFRQQHPEVSLICATWDALADSIPSDDPLGWYQAAQARRAELWAAEELFVGRARLPDRDAQSSMQGPEMNWYGRGVRALALRVAAECEMSVIHGPVFGDYHPDPQVDIARRDWVIDLPRPAIVDAKTQADQARLSIRARFRVNQAGELQLGIGTCFVPYPPAYPQLANYLKGPGKHCLDAGLATRAGLRKLLGGGSTNADAWWAIDRILEPSSRDWNDSRVAVATKHLKEIMGTIDEVAREARTRMTAAR